MAKKVFGYFHCMDCNRNWQSGQTWLNRNNEPFGQNCQRCGDLVIPHETVSNNRMIFGAFLCKVFFVFWVIFTKLILIVQKSVIICVILI